MRARFSIRSYSSFDFVLILLIVVLERLCNHPFHFCFIAYYCCFLFEMLSIVGGIMWNHRSSLTIVGSPTSFVRLCDLHMPYCCLIVVDIRN